MFRRRAPANPTHGWLIGNRIIRKLAWAFILLVLFMVIAISTITYAIRRDCQHPYNRDIKLFSYWLYVEAGSNEPGCPGPGG